MVSTGEKPRIFTFHYVVVKKSDLNPNLCKFAFKSGSEMKSIYVFLITIIYVYTFKINNFQINGEYIWYIIFQVMNGLRLL